MKKQQIIIDPEFEKLMPKLTSEEYEKLYEDIGIRGVRDKIVLWAEKNIILDGHNRYKIANELDCLLSYDFISCSSRDEAKIWIIKNQLGRRNLTKAAKVMYLNEVLKPLLSAQAEARMKAGKADDNPPPISAGGEVRDEIAAEAGVGHSFVHQVETILTNGTPEQVDTIMTKEGTVNKTYNEVKGAIKPMPEPEMPACNICGDMVCHPIQINWVGVRAKGHVCDSCAMSEPLSKVHGLLKQTK